MPPRAVRQTAAGNGERTSAGLAGMRSGWNVTDSVKMLLYGRSGSGKTVLWSTFPKPILAILCSGGKRPGELKSINTPELRKVITPYVINTVADVKTLVAMADKFATVVLDHCSGLQDLTLKEILGLDELPAQKSWGLASQQQYGQSSLQCKEIFRSLLDVPSHVVFVAQERTFGEGSEGEVIQPTVGPALTPSVTGWLMPACDYVVQAFLRPKVERVTRTLQGKEVTSEKRLSGVEYCLRTEPHETFMTKFRCPVGTPIPDALVNPTYEKIVAVTRGEVG